MSQAGHALSISERITEGISIKTVEKHREKVMSKLDVNVYTMGGTEPGAFRTAGGQRFFEFVKRRERAAQQPRRPGTRSGIGMTRGRTVAICGR